METVHSTVIRVDDVVDDVVLYAHCMQVLCNITFSDLVTLYIF
jgi:hypothetical protein